MLYCCFDKTYNNDNFEFASLFYYTLINGFYAVPAIFQPSTCDDGALFNRAPENALYEP